MGSTPISVRCTKWLGGVLQPSHMALFSCYTNDIKCGIAPLFAPFLFTKFFLKFLLLLIIFLTWIGSCHELHSWMTAMPIVQAGVKNTNGFFQIATRVYHWLKLSFGSPHTSPVPLFHICHELAAYFEKDCVIYYGFYIRSSPLYWVTVHRIRMFHKQHSPVRSCSILPSAWVPHHCLSMWVSIILLLAICTHPRHQQQLFSQFSSRDNNMTNITSGLMINKNIQQEPHKTATAAACTNRQDGS